MVGESIKMCDILPKLYSEVRFAAPLDGVSDDVEATDNLTDEEKPIDLRSIVGGLEKILLGETGEIGFLSQVEQLGRDLLELLNSGRGHLLFGVDLLGNLSPNLSTVERFLPSDYRGRLAVEIFLSYL